MQSVQLVALSDTLRVSAAVVNRGGDTLSSAVAWTSSDTTIATVTASVLVTSRGVGSTTLTATSDTVEGTLPVSVAQVPAIIEVAPAADTLDAIGDTVQLTVLVKDRNSHAIPDPAVAWSSADPAIVAVNESGQAVSKKRGTVAIEARIGEVVGTALILSRQVLASVVVAPAEVGLVPGDSLRFSATALDGNGVPIDTLTSFAWASSNEAVSTVSDGGMVHAVAVGAAEIQVTLTGAAEGFQVSGSVEVDGLALATLDVGAAHNCGLTGLGALYCWGDNTNGQIGDGTREPRVEPVRAPQPLSFQWISLGDWHSCGIDADGETFCWGANWDKQLTGEDSEVLDPRPIASTLEFVAVYGGGAHSCGLTVSGQAYCWGYNGLGQLGIGSNDDDPHAEPVAVAGDYTFVRLAAGQHHTCGLTAAGVAYCWGGDNAGELGDGDGSSTCTLGEFVHNCRTTPAPVAGGLLFDEIVLGDHHSCALATTGAAYCWGNNSFGQLGQGAADDGPHVAPEAVSGGLEFRSLGAGLHHVCGIASDGLTYCWGKDGGTVPTPVARQQP